MKTYRGITFSSLIVKLLEIIFLHRLSPLLDDISFMPSMKRKKLFSLISEIVEISTVVSMTWTGL